MRIKRALGMSRRNSSPIRGGLAQIKVREMKSSVLVGALSLSFALAIVGFESHDSFAAGPKELEQDARTALKGPAR